MQRLSASRWLTPGRRTRLLCADLALGVNCVGYYGAASMAHVPTALVLPASALDKLVDFNIWALVPYLSLFLMMGLTYLRVAPAQVPRLLVTGWLCLGVALLAFLGWPTVVEPSFREAATGPAVRSWPWLQWIQSADTPANCLPSLHAALSVACTLCVQRSGLRRAAFVWWCWTGLILWSAVALRQHLSLDLAAGAVLAMVAYGLSGMLVHRWKWPRTLERAVT